MGSVTRRRSPLPSPQTKDAPTVKLLTRKRVLIETVNDQLKNISQIEHTRHRSRINFMVNLLAGLIAYTYQDKKPSLNLRVGPTDQLPILV